MSLVGIILLDSGTLTTIFIAPVLQCECAQMCNLVPKLMYLTLQEYVRGARSVILLDQGVSCHSPLQTTLDCCYSILVAGQVVLIHVF